MPGWMGAATRLSLQGGCVQAKDASEDSSAPTYRDSRGSKPRELSGIMGEMHKCKLVLTFVLNSLRHHFFLQDETLLPPISLNKCLLRSKVFVVLQLYLVPNISVLVCLVFYSLFFFHPFLVSLFLSQFISLPVFLFLLFSLRY